MPSESDVLEALRPVEDPELHRSIVDLDMVRSVVIAGDKVTVTVALTVAGCPLRAEITRRVTDAVTALPGVADVDVDLTVMTDEERHALTEKLHAHTATAMRTRTVRVLSNGRIPSPIRGRGSLRSRRARVAWASRR